MKAKSSRGQATRQRIIEAAARLMQTNGVNGTSVDDVLAASSTGKSQFYHYFASKDALVRELIAHQVATLPAAQEDLCAGLASGSLAGIEAWLEQILDDFRGGLYDTGCPIGNLASELSAQNEDRRLEIWDVFVGWQSRLAEGFSRMQSTGDLPPSAEPDSLATWVLACVQGALLLAKTQRAIAPLEVTFGQLKNQLKAMIGSSAAGRLAAAPRAGAVAAEANPRQTKKVTEAGTRSQRPAPPRRAPLSFCP